MRISINNLGPIKSFAFDLSKDLNIIFGKNNIGKSYAITAIYLIIKNLLSRDSDGLRHLELDYYFFNKVNYLGSQIYGDSNISSIIEEKEETIKQTLKSKNLKEIDVTEDVKSIFKKIIELNIIPNLERSFDNSFASVSELQNKFSNEPFKITIYLKELDFSIAINSKNKFYIGEINFSNKIVLRKAKANRKPHTSEGIVYLYYNTNDSNTKNRNFIWEYVAKLFIDFKNEVRENVDNIYFLPASRSGLYQALSTFSAVIAELSKSRNFLRSKIELPNISEPVSDYFLYLSKISKPSSKNKYSKIVKDIENFIIRGEVKFNFDSQKIVFYSPEIESELDLSVTSSMISEIAPIVAYLKFIIPESDINEYYYMYERRKKVPQKSNMIFIEEPEAHLHPAVQVLLMNMFVELANMNIKIIMTTHSNYMFNKLNNLILDKKIRFEKVGSYLIKMTDKGSILDEYAMQADKQGMVDENFVDISEKLYEERQKIFEKGEIDAHQKD